MPHRYRTAGRVYSLTWKRCFTPPTALIRYRGSFFTAPRHFEWVVAEPYVSHWGEAQNMSYPSSSASWHDICVSYLDTRQATYSGVYLGGCCIRLQTESLCSLPNQIPRLSEFTDWGHVSWFCNMLLFGLVIGSGFLVLLQLEHLIFL